MNNNQKNIFPEKWQHHLKRLMIFFFFTQNNYKKWLNGSKDSNLKNQEIWLIESFAHKSREWEFSQVWCWRRKSANHHTLRLKSFLAKTNNFPQLSKNPIFAIFLAKTNELILRKIPKSPFLPILDTFSRKFPRIGVCHFLAYMDA